MEMTERASCPQVIACRRSSYLRVVTSLLENEGRPADLTLASRRVFVVSLCLLDDKADAIVPRLLAATGMAGTASAISHLAMSRYVRCDGRDLAR